MSNPYARELHQQMTARYNVETDDMPNSEWLTKNTRLKGRPFSFSRYPFQQALVDDVSRASCTVKPSQVGVSEIYQRLGLTFITRHSETKGIYAYPGDDMRKKNVQTRVQPLVETTRAFNPPTLDSPIRSIQLIQIGRSFLYVTGSKAEDATSTDADFLLIDEYDLHDMQIAALFSSRLQNSDYKIERTFSTPTFTLFGIDAMYTSSDQTMYLIKCDACNHWQFPTFAPHFIEMANLPGDFNDLSDLDADSIESFKIDVEGSYVCCERCRAPLDLGRTDNREWVSKYPSRTKNLKGWKVNPFSTSTRPPSEIVSELIKYKSRDFLRGWKNSVLGEPEDSSSVRLPEADIKACFIGGNREVPKIDRDMPTWLGIDMGHMVHLVALQGHKSMGTLRAIIMERFPIEQLIERVKQLVSTYNLAGGLVDRHPQSQPANDVRDATNKLVLPCEYRGLVEINIVYTASKEVSHAQANRTDLLDAAARLIRRKHVIFNGYGHLESEIVSHLRNMVRVESPEEPATWKKLDPSDHFFHALGFAAQSMLMRNLVDLKTTVPQTCIGVLGADIGGYTPKLLGQQRKSTIWQPTSLLS